MCPSNLIFFYSLAQINTTIEYFPWQLSLRVRQIHICGASILSPTRATPMNAFSVLVGSTLCVGDRNSFVSKIDHFIVHSGFNRITKVNDIGVLWLKSIYSSFTAYELARNGHLKAVLLFFNQTKLSKLENILLLFSSYFKYLMFY